MPIHTIRNNATQNLELWDAGRRLGILPPGSALHNAPVTISGVTLGGLGYHTRRGAFVNGESYEVTYLPPSVKFEGDPGVPNVYFT